MDRLRHPLRQLRRMQFGRRSEKIDPEQLLLAFEDLEQAIASNEAAEDKKDSAGAHRCRLFSAVMRWIDRAWLADATAARSSGW
jgi:hypothetical protein